MNLSLVNHFINTIRNYIYSQLGNNEKQKTHSLEHIATRVQCLMLPSPVTPEQEGYNDGVEDAVNIIKRMEKE